MTASGSDFGGSTTVSDSDFGGSVIFADPGLEGSMFSVYGFEGSVATSGSGFGDSMPAVSGLNSFIGGADLGGDLVFTEIGADSISTSILDSS
jgi:hypothetical protein